MTNIKLRNYISPDVDKESHQRGDVPISGSQFSMAKKLLDHFGLHEDHYLQQVSTPSPRKHWIYEGYLSGLSLTPKYKEIQDHMTKGSWKLYLESYPDLINDGLNDEEKARTHFIFHGYDEGRIFPDRPKDQRLQEELDKSVSNLLSINNIFSITPLITILTRTHNRPNLFPLSRKSVEEQTYGHKEHIVCYDNEKSLEYLSSFPGKKIKVDPTSNGKYFYNLYLNRLLLEVHEGWVLVLDDDDGFVSPLSLEYLVSHLTDPRDMLCWRFWTPDKIIPESIRSDGKIIECQIASCGVLFPIMQWKPWIQFTGDDTGDYEFFKGMKEHTNIKWLKEIVTRTYQKSSRGYGN